MAKRLLVIDDEKDIRDLVRISLEELAGWQVITAETGQDGLEKANTTHWDAIILDVSMPGTNGIDVIAQLQANPVTQSIPVIFLTAKASVSDRHRFAALNVAGIIPKPFEPITLSQQIAALLHWSV